MGWTVKLTPEAKADLAKLGTPEARRVLHFLNTRLQKRDNPRELGEPLKGTFREYWRYRVGDYRIICRLEDGVITVFVLHVGHRGDVYKTT
jgi:mRNA interferase RelE/StbE